MFSWMFCVKLSPWLRMSYFMFLGLVALIESIKRGRYMRKANLYVAFVDQFLLVNIWSSYSARYTYALAAPSFYQLLDLPRPYVVCLQIIYYGLATLFGVARHSDVNFEAWLIWLSLSLWMILRQRGNVLRFGPDLPRDSFSIFDLIYILLWSISVLISTLVLICFAN